MSSSGDYVRCGPACTDVTDGRPWVPVQGDEGDFDPAFMVWGTLGILAGGGLFIVAIIVLVAVFGGSL